MKFLFSCSLALISTLMSFAGGGYLGINISDANDNFHKKTDAGVLITKVIEGTGADKAGLKTHDIILSINGENVNATNELISYLNTMNPGENVSLKVIRGDETQNVDVELGERIAMRLHKDPKKWVFYSDHQGAWLGVSYEALNEDLAEFFGVNNGVLVKKVEKDSPAMEAGLRAGDVITEIDGKTLATNKDFLKVLASHEEGDQINLTLNRRGNIMDAMVTLAANENSFSNFNRFFKSGNHFNFNLDSGDFEELHELPHRLKMMKPMLENLESGSFEELQQQLQDLREELEQLKKDKNH